MYKCCPFYFFVIVAVIVLYVFVCPCVHVVVLLVDSITFIKLYYDLPCIAFILLSCGVDC